MTGPAATDDGAGSAGAVSLRSSTIGVIGIRLVGAGLHLAFALPLVAVLGPDDAGRTLAAVSSIELASLVGRLGLPIELARRRRLGGRRTALPVPSVAVAAAASGLVAAMLAWLTGLPPVHLVVGAGAVTVAQVLAGWQRGAERFLVASLAHPVPALSAATIALLVGGLAPLTAFVAGASIAAITQLALARSDLRLAASTRSAVAHLAGTAQLGAAGLANQAVLLSIPVLLVAQGHPEGATVFSLAVGAFRPLLILQAGLNFTVGPRLAAATGEPLTPRQRVVLDQAAGLQHLAFLPYAVLTGLAVAAASRGLLIGHPLPTLPGSWLILLIGHAVGVGTGPTGQVLLMRGNERATVGAALAGLAAAATWFVLPLPAWARAAGALSAALATQNALTAVGAWTNDRWIADPLTIWPSAWRALVDASSGLWTGASRAGAVRTGR